jgi:hypothetical protein
VGAFAAATAARECVALCTDCDKESYGWENKEDFNTHRHSNLASQRTGANHEVELRLPP